jgi:hypothetical protein
VRWYTGERFATAHKIPGAALCALTDRAFAIDVAAMSAWLVRVFGFRERSRWPDDQWGFMQPLG